VLQPPGQAFDFGAGEAGGERVIGVGAYFYLPGGIPPDHQGTGVGAIHGAGGNCFHEILSTKITVSASRRDPTAWLRDGGGAWARGDPWFLLSDDFWRAASNPISIMAIEKLRVLLDKCIDPALEKRFLFAGFEITVAKD
jgi:hypothetical protein